MEKITKILGIVLLLGIIFAGFTGAVSADNVKITEIDISGITTPSGDVAPSTINPTITMKTGENNTVDSNCYSVSSISWTKEGSTFSGNFEAGKTYKASFTINLKNTGDDTYSIDDTTTIKKPTDADNVSKSSTSNSYTIEVTYSNTPKSQIDSIVVEQITAPSINSTPSTTAPKVTLYSGQRVVSENYNYSVGNITWNDNSNTEISGNFEAGKSYKAIFDLTITNTNDYDLTANTVTKPTDADSGSITGTNPYTISIVYPAMYNTIKTIDVSSITTPTANADPVTNAPNVVIKDGNNGTLKPTSDYTIGEIIWTKGDDSSFTDKFQDATEYKAKFDITLVNTTSYKLPTTDDGLTINGPGKTNTGTIAGNKVTITVTYPKIGLKTIKSIDIPSSSITAPTADAEPVKTEPKVTVTDTSSNTVDASKYGVSKITWKTSEGIVASGKFADGESYKAEFEITLDESANYEYPSSSSELTITGPGTSNAATISNDKKTATITVTYPGIGVKTVSNIVIDSSSITAPVAGVNPVKTAPTLSSVTATDNSSIATSNFSQSTITWKDEAGNTLSGTFAVGVKYVAEFTITSTNSSKYLIPSDASKLTITGPGTSITKTVSGSIITVKITYPAAQNTSVSSMALNVTAPALDATPSATVTTSTKGVSASASWIPNDSKFTAAKEYTVNINVTTNSGYIFSTSLSATVNGNNASITRNSDTSATVKYTFAKLATPISSVAIKMDEPVAGKDATKTSITVTSSPSSTIDAAISWNPTIPESGEFDEETQYKATITLTNKDSSYAFTSNTTAKVNGEPATVSSPSATTMTVTYTFDETNKKGIFSLPIGDDVATVPYPKDFLSELVALLQAIFDFDNWKLFN